MGFGNQLLQAAQGLIANDQKRQQLELQEEQQKQQSLQAERTFQLREQEVTARQGFLDVQQKQLEAKVAEAASPEAQLKIQLDLDLVSAQIRETDSRTAARSGGVKTQTVSDTLRLGEAHQKVTNDAKTKRVDVAIIGILDNKTAPPGVDVGAVLGGLNAVGVRSWAGLLGAIENAQKSVRAAENLTNVSNRFKEARLTEVITRRDTLQKTMGALRPIFDAEVTPGEFRDIAPDVWTPAFTNELFANGGTIEGRKLDIWGDSLFASGRGKALDIAIDDLRDGKPDAMNNFVNTFPGDLLDEDGRITESAIDKLAPYFNAEGIPQAAGIDFIRSFNQR